jgi:fumarate reductase flavoprotein subunit
MKKNTHRFFFGFAALFMAVMLIFTGCPQPEESTKKMNGTYDATAQGFNGEYTVHVTVGEDDIKEITTENLTDSPHTGVEAIKALTEQMITLQTCALDAVTGATISSSSFLGAVKAALQKAGAPEKLLTKPAYTVVDKTEDVDILIIGSGIAGLSAAVQASTDKPNAKIVIIEKLPFIGGSTKFAAGVVLGTAPAKTGEMFPGGPPAGLGGDADSADIPKLKEFFKVRGQGWVDEELVGYWADESWETLKFLGMDKAMSSASGTMTEFRMRFPADFVSGTVNASGGYGLALMLAGKAAEKGVTTLKSVKATKLITENGAVTGVEAVSNTVKYTFKAKAVIIATGGFDADRDGLMAQYNKDSQYDIPQSSKSSTGDGIKMAKEIGADTVFKGGKIGWVAIDVSLGEAMHYSAWIVKQDGSLLDYTAPGAKEAGTNSAGVSHPKLEASEYANNPQDYAVNHLKMLEARAAAGGSLDFYGLYRATGNAGLPIINNATQQPYPGSERFVTRASTISGLASQVTGMDTEKLSAAFTAASLGEDSQATGDYVLVKAIPSSIGSMGGIKINKNAEVLKAGGAVIPGLYAAGETANGDMFYREYPGSGSSLSISATFGRTAGKQAASKL